MQHLSDTSYARPSWCFESVRYWGHLLIPSRHVRSVVPNPWEPAARPDTSYAYWNCCSLPVRSCSPSPIPRRHVREPAARPDTLYAYSIWCSLPVRYCSPILITLMHIGSDVPYPWDPAAPSRYALGMNFLVFRIREILQPRPNTS